MKLLIRNLNRTTTEGELKAMFEVYGTVQSCTLILDKETSSSKGFGFIVMPKPGDAKAAMKGLNGKDVAGSQIRVKKAESINDKSKNREKGLDHQNTQTGSVTESDVTKEYKHSGHK